MKAVKAIMICSILLFLSNVTFGQTVIIVNSANDVSNITQSTAADYFLGKSTQWPSAGKVAPIEQNKTSEAGKAFLSKIIKMGDGDYKNYWVEKMLSGEAEPSKSFNSDADVINFVKQNKGAIGYVNEASVTDGVKVISIDGTKSW